MTALVAATVAPLSVRRLTPGDWLNACRTGTPPLGGLAYGSTPSLRPATDGPATAHIAARALSDQGPMVDAWVSGSGAPQHRGHCGSVAWRHDGQWLFGTLELDEFSSGEDLAALAEHAYRDVFATLDQTGFHHPLRLWNYLPQINGDDHGTERYRRFNAGRQQAFLQAGRPAFEGAPAACALGPREGPLCVSFLAGRHAPLPLENPRQVSAYHYPADHGPRSPSFSRAALADAGGGQVALFISGTSSISGHQSQHAGDVGAQTRETLTNLRAVLLAAHRHTSARFSLAELQCVVYLRHAEQLPLVRAELEAATGPEAPLLRNAVWLEADICRRELWVEIEAHAFAPGEVQP